MKLWKRNSKPNLDKIVPGQEMRARDGTVYRADNVITDGNGVLDRMTLERADPKRPAGVSGKRWRKEAKAARRLERERRQRRERIVATVTGL